MQILNMVATMLLFILGGLVAIGGILMVWARVSSKGKMIASFHDNGTFWSVLLKEDSDHNCLWLGREGSENREKYAIDEEKIELVRYPGMLPSILTVPVRSLEYVRHNPEPYHPSKTHKSKITAVTFRLVTDENMLKSQWKDIRDALGLKQRPSGLALMILIAVFAVALLSLYSIYVSAQTQAITQQLYNLLHGTAGVTP